MLTALLHNIYTVIQDVPLTRISEIRFPHIPAQNCVEMLRTNYLKFQDHTRGPRNFQQKSFSICFPAKRKPKV
jgi:hypothetical protein